MKIFGNNLELDGLKFLYTTRNLEILKQIQTSNPSAVILTPFTKYCDLFNFKKENPLYELMNQEQPDYREKLLNEPFVVSFIQKVNAKLGIELFDYDLDYDKLLKTVISLSDQYVEPEHIPHILAMFDQFIAKRTQVVIAGFEPAKTIYTNLDLLYVLTSLKGQVVQYNTLESLWIDNQKHNKIFVVEDQEKLISWLELETKTVISPKQLNDFLKGERNYDSFLLENSFQKICEIEI